MKILSDKVTIFGEHDDKTIAQIMLAAENEHVVRASLQPDGHLGYAVPIGGVVAYENAVSPSGVGFDISCGNKAVLTDMPGSALRHGIKPIMDQIWSTISFGVGRKNNERVHSPLFDGKWAQHWELEATRPLKKKAEEQLGTIGSGNHYVDLFTDEQDRVWIGVHFGSRGLGHGIASWFLKAAGAKDGMEVEPCVLSLGSDLGQQYLLGMDLGSAYAYAGRDWVCERVARILGANILEEVHNNHNLAFPETHEGRDLWVVRKGATPAFPGQKGFVGGTMGEQSVILEGVDHDLAKYSLYSTVHGAGRAMGRKEATGVTKKNKQTGEVRVVREGRVTPQMMQGWVDRSGIELRGAGLDESPDCYKRLDQVLAEAPGIKILHRLTPVGVCMAGAHEFDPYKD